MSEKLKFLVQEWITFERESFISATANFSYSSLLSLTKQEVMEWAYNTRDDLLSKRLDLCSSIKLFFIDNIKSLSRGSKAKMVRGILKLLEEIERLITSEFDSLTNVISMLESGEPLESYDVKAQIENLGLCENKIRKYLSQFYHYVQNFF